MYTAQLSDRLAVDVRSAQALRAKAAKNDPEALRSAAKQFEAMVVQMMLKTLREAKVTDEGDVFGDSNSLKLYQDLLDQQWSQKMAEGKGLGFAAAMVKAMEARAKTVVGGLPPSGIQAGGVAAAPPPASGPAPAPAPTAGAEAPVSAGGGVSASAPKPSAEAAGDPRRAFLDRLRPAAEKIAGRMGVPADFILGHAALETGWGRRAIVGEAGENSHNLFGIKAGQGWGGESVEITTTEYRQGVPMKLVDRFRAYPGFDAALEDYAALLAKRYPAAVGVGKDARAFANALASGGYATDPAYAQKLRGVIASVANV